MGVKISIIIPMYNSEKYLNQCLDSIKNQTFTDFEAILVDDGSTDRTVAIANSYCCSDSRFELIKKEHVDGTGAGPARNLGYQNSTGEYVLFLDSDDYFEHNMLEVIYSKAKECDSQIVIFNANILDEKTGKESVYLSYGPLGTDVLPENETFSPQDIPEHIFQTVWGAAWNVLVQRSHIEQKHISFQATRFQDDVFFTYLCLAEASRITAIKDCYIHYRINVPTNQTATRYKHLEIMYDAPLKLMQELTSRNLFEIYKISFWDRFLTPMLRFIFVQDNFSDYVTAYNLFKDKLLKQMRWDEYLDVPVEKVYRPMAFENLKNITKYNADEFIFLKRYDELHYINGYTYPTEIISKNIIIYGAGGYGRKFYGRAWIDNYANIVAWVDKNYEKLGSPVYNPAIIPTLEYDYILIAITDKNVCDKVKEYLLSIGVEASKIKEITEK